MNEINKDPITQSMRQAIADLIGNMTLDEVTGKSFSVLLESKAVDEAILKILSECNSAVSIYKEQIKELKATVCALRDPLSNFIALTNESEGVAGWHRNGNVAQWDSFSFISKAVAMLADTSGNFYAQRDAEMFECGYIAGWTSRNCEEEGEVTAEESFSEFMYEAQRS